MSAKEDDSKSISDSEEILEPKVVKDDNIVGIAKEQNAIVSMIDKKVVIKEKIEKGKKKTVVSGLEIIEELSSDKGLRNFSKKLKTTFGCGCQLTIDTDTKQKILIFQGNHKDKIRALIKDKYPNIQVA